LGRELNPVNYPDLKLQRDRIDAHDEAALMMAGILLAAGAFTGIMKESGMLVAMAKALVARVLRGAAGHMPFVLGLVSMPLSLLFDPDSFSTFRIVGLAGIELSEHQKFTMPFLLAASVLVTLAAVAFGVFPV
jgi:CitMHS family citrate-Mg2+:H+ or citrate-Ca2+:H+ symporter